MNKKQLSAAIIIFIILLVICIMNLKQEESSWKKGSDTDQALLIKNFEPNKVAKFAIADGKDTVEMAVMDNKWAVLQRDEYPADFTKIQNLLLNIQELKVAQRVRIKKSDLGKLKLLPPIKDRDNPSSGTMISFYDSKDLEIASLILGEHHFSKAENPNPFAPPQADGRYLIINGTEEPMLIRDPLGEVVPKPAQWLDKKFPAIRNLASLALFDKTGKESWKIERKDEKAPFVLAGIEAHEKPNPQKMQGATSAFAAMSFIDVFPGKTDIKDFGLDKSEKVSIRTFDGFTYKVDIGLHDKKAFAKFAITAELAEKRTPGRDEKPEDKEKLDTQFAAKLKSLKEKLKNEQFYTQWIYELPVDKVNHVLLKRQDLVVENKEVVPPPNN